MPRRKNWQSTRNSDAEGKPPANAAVEIAPISEEWRGPLRFMAGIAAGYRAGTLADSAYTALTRPTLLTSTTRTLAGLRTQLAELDATIRSQASPATQLIQTRARLVRDIATIEDGIRQLRTLGGQAEALRDAEANLTRSMNGLADMEARLFAPGMSPSQRAALRLNNPGMQGARESVSVAQQRLQDVYNTVEAAALNDPTLRAGLPRIRGVQALQRHREDIERARQVAQRELDEYLAIQARDPNAQVPNASGTMSEVAYMIARRRGRLTELVGEIAAAEYMAAQPNMVMLRGFRTGRGIDQIWARLDRNGNIVEYFIVEAKGVGATLAEATATSPGQMTDAWMRLRLASLQRYGRTAEERQLAGDIIAALNDPERRVSVTRRILQADGTGGANQLPLPPE